jgi:hypothetical protein
MASDISPLWRWLITDLDGAGITFLDKLASDRIVTPKLNEPLELSGTVPSDSPEINIFHTDDLPFLAEGVRQLYGFRRERNVDPYYTIRASTLILQTADASSTGDARTRFTAWDPWQYLFYRPLLFTDVEHCSYIPRKGKTFTDWHPIDLIVDWLYCMLFNSDTEAPGSALQGFIDWGQSGFYTGTMDYGLTSTLKGFNVQPGTSLGQAIQDLCSTGYCDVVMEPIYDPVNRPGLLCQMSIYEQDPSDPNTGAGRFNYGAVFAWDRPGRSLVGFDDLFDGTQRANLIGYRSGQAGAFVNADDLGTPIYDPDSIKIYGEYWAELAITAQNQAEGFAVQALAAEQLALRKTYKQTLTVNPAPERAPEPWVDYEIGDRVPIFIGTAERGTYQLGDNSSRQPLPPGYSGGPPTPDPAVYVWQRVYGIPVRIDDNGVETVEQLLVGPIGAPPPAFGARIGSGGSGGQQALPTSTTKHTTSAGTVRPGAPGIAT